MITDDDDAKCRREMKCGIAMTKSSFNKKQALVTSKLQLHVRKKPVKCHTLRIAVSCAENGALLKAGMMCLESFEMWCWRRMEKIRWADRVRNE